MGPGAAYPQPTGPSRETKRGRFSVGPVRASLTEQCKDWRFVRSSVCQSPELRTPPKLQAPSQSGAFFPIVGFAYSLRYAFARCYRAARHIASLNLGCGWSPAEGEFP